MDEKLKKALQDYVATANSGKYNSWETLNSKFPEFKDYDTEILQDYVATANSGKYSNWDEINTKFPELFPKQPEVPQGSEPTSQTYGEQLSNSVEPLSGNDFVNRLNIRNVVANNQTGLDEELRYQEFAIPEGTQVIPNRVNEYGLPVYAKVNEDGYSEGGSVLEQAEVVLSREGAIKRNNMTQDELIEYNEKLNQKIENITFLEGVANSWENFTNSLKTLPETFEIAMGGGSIARPEAIANMTDDERKRYFSQRQDAYVQAFEELENFKDTNPPLVTGEIVRGWTNGNLKDFTLGTINAMFGLGKSIILGSVQGGIPLAVDLIGEFTYDYNTKKAEKLGISVEELVAQGKDQDVAPKALAVTSFIFEKIGLEGGWRMIPKELRTKIAKKILDNPYGEIISKTLVDAPVEGITEILSTGIKGTSDALVENPDMNNGEILYSILDKAFDAKNLEEFWSGFVSKLVLGGGANLLKKNTLGDAELKNKIQELEKVSTQLALNPEDKVLLSVHDKLVSEVSEKIKVNGTKVINLPQEQRLQVDEKTSLIVEAEERLKNEKDVDIKKAIEDDIVATESEIQDIINQESNVTENEQWVSSEIQEGQELIETQPIEETSTEAVETSGDVQTQEEVVIPINESFIETLIDDSKRTSRLSELEAKIKSSWNSSNLGVANNPKKEAEFLRDLTEYAVLRIADGTIKTADAFVKATKGLGDFSESLLTKAFNNAQDIATEYLNTNPETNSINQGTGEVLTRLQDVTKDRSKVKTKVTSSTVRQVTEGKIQGEVTIPNKQALATQIQALNRGAKDMGKNVKELAQTIKAYIQSRTKVPNSRTGKLTTPNPTLRGAKLSPRVINSLAKAVSGVTNEKQLNNALNIVDKVITDAEFGAKLNGVASLQSKLRNKVSSPRIPVTQKNLITQFSKINLTDLSAEQLDRYIAKLESLSSIPNFTPNSVSAVEMQSFIDMANENAEVKKMEREQSKLAREASDEWKQEQVEKRTKRLLSAGLTESEVKELINSEDLDTTLKNLSEANGSLSQVREQALRDKATQMFNDITTNLDSIKEGMSKTSKKLLDYFVTNLDIGKLPKQHLKGLSFVLDNILNNQSTEGIGTISTIGRFTKVRDDKVLLDKVKSSLRTATDWERFFMKFGTHGSQDIESTVYNARDNMYPFAESYAGYGTYELNSQKAIKEHTDLLKEFDKLLKKYGEKHFSKRVDWVNADIYSVMMQYEDPEVAVLRMVKGLEDSKRHFNSQKVIDHGSFLDRVEGALNKIAEWSVDSEGNVEITSLKKDAETIFKELPKGIQEYYKKARDWSDANKESYFSTIEAFENKVNDEIPNYLPISHYDYSSNTTTDLTDTSISGGELLRKTNSTAYKERTIVGANNPQGKMLNLGNMLANFPSHAGSILNDIHTLGDRKYMALALDYQKNGIEDYLPQGTDYHPFDTLAMVAGRKAEGDKLRYRSNTTADVDVFNVTGRMVSTLATQQSLSSYQQILKQITPLINTFFAMKKPSNFFLAFKMLNSPEGRGLLSEYANVTYRDINSTYFASEKSSHIEAEANSKLEKLFKNFLRDLNVTISERTPMAKWFKTTMVLPDKLVSQASWLALYLDKATEGGKIASLTNPDMEAVFYANRRASTVNNESDPSIASKLSQNKLFKLMFPFMSFASNARVDLAMQTGRLLDPKSDSTTRKEAGRQVVGNIVNIIAFHAISETLKQLVYKTSGLTLNLAIDALYDEGDEDDKKKRLEDIATHLNNLSDRSLLQRMQYMISDIIMGGVPILSDVTSAGVGAGLKKAYEHVLGKDFVKDVNYTGTPFNGKNPLEGTSFEGLSGAYDTFRTVGGTMGIGVENFINIGKALNDYPMFDSTYHQKMFSFMDATGKPQVESIITDPETKEMYDVSEYYQVVSALHTAVSVMRLGFFSDQGLTSLANTMMSTTKKVHEKAVGKMKTPEQLEKLRKEVLEFKEVNGVELTNEQQLQISTDYLKQVAKLYKEDSWNSNKRDMTREDYENNVKKYARLEAIGNFIDKNSKLFDASTEEKYKDKEEKAKLREKIIKYNK